jgi:hypothetical protein
MPEFLTEFLTAVETKFPSTSTEIRSTKIYNNNEKNMALRWLVKNVSCLPHSISKIWNFRLPLTGQFRDEPLWSVRGSFNFGCDFLKMIGTWLVLALKCEKLLYIRTLWIVTPVGRTCNIYLFYHKCGCPLGYRTAHFPEEVGFTTSCNF